MTQRRHRVTWPFVWLLCSAGGLGACSVADIDDGRDARADTASDTAAFSDRVGASCTDPGWAPGPCGEPVETEAASVGADHVLEPTPIEYAVDPPSSGPHRPAWARWGEYDYLPPQRWVHNLEHGGVALLYHPCADAASVDALRAFAEARPEDDGGAFRWVLTPYVDLPSAVAVVAWEHTWTTECVDAGALESLSGFVDAHYRQASEDVASDGSYEDGWIGR